MSPHGFRSVTANTHRSQIHGSSAWARASPIFIWRARISISGSPNLRAGLSPRRSTRARSPAGVATRPGQPAKPRNSHPYRAARSTHRRVASSGRVDPHRLPSPAPLSQHPNQRTLGRLHIDQPPAGGPGSSSRPRISVAQRRHASARSTAQSHNNNEDPRGSKPRKPRILSQSSNLSPTTHAVEAASLAAAIHIALSRLRRRTQPIRVSQSAHYRDDRRLKALKDALVAATIYRRRLHASRKVQQPLAALVRLFEPFESRRKVKHRVPFSLSSIQIALMYISNNCPKIGARLNREA